MSLVLKDYRFAREHTIRLGNLSQEGVECSCSERGVGAQTAQSLLLDNEQVDGKELLTGEAFFLETGHFTNLFSDGASFDEGLLVNLVNFHENL